MGEVQEEPGLSSLPSLPGRVTWVLGYLCVSGPGQSPGVLDPACLPAPWDVEQHRNSMEKSGNSSWHREGLQLWVLPTRLGTRCVCTHIFLQWILEGKPSGRSGHAEIRGAVGNRFPKTCSLQLNPVLRSGILQEMPVGGDEIPLVQRSGAGHPFWESSSHKLISWDPGGHVRLIALLLPLICYPNNYIKKEGVKERPCWFCSG